MVKYKQIYLKSLGYSPSDFIACELSGEKAVDIHHIISRGKKGKDRIENLMALTRENHLKYGDKKQFMKLLLIKHKEFLDFNGVTYDNNYFNELIKKYEDYSK